MSSSSNSSAHRHSASMMRSATPSKPRPHRSAVDWYEVTEIPWPIEERQAAHHQVKAEGRFQAGELTGPRSRALPVNVAMQARLPIRMRVLAERACIRGGCRLQGYACAAFDANLRHQPLCCGGESFAAETLRTCSSSICRRVSGVSRTDPSNRTAAVVVEQDQRSFFEIQPTTLDPASHGARQWPRRAQGRPLPRWRNHSAWQAAVHSASAEMAPSSTATSSSIGSVAADRMACGEHVAVTVVLDLWPHHARRIDQYHAWAQIETLLLFGDGGFVADLGDPTPEQCVHPGSILPTFGIPMIIIRNGLVPSSRCGASDWQSEGRASHHRASCTTAPRP